MSKTIYKAGALMLIACAAATNASAQGYTSAALDLLKEQKLWFHTTNAAGSVLDNVDNYSLVNIGWGQEKGDFNRPQQGDRQTSININCEGFMNLKSAYAWGEFSFEQRNISDAQFNASITDPYRGMPYFMADTHSSDWRNQYYNMKFRVGSPLYWNKLAIGIEGVYKASLAAKQLDPRVDTRYFQLDLNPGIVYAIDKNQSIGADFQFSALKEDSRMQNVNATVSQTYYVLFGLGVASEQIGDGESTDYQGRKLGGGIQYNYKDQGFNFLASVDYTRRVENFNRSRTIPKKEAAVNDHICKVDIAAQWKNENWSNFLNLSGTFGSMDGIQYVNTYDNTDSFQGWVDLYHAVRSTYKTTLASVDYSLLRNRGDEYAWRVGAGVEYVKYDNEYILPYSVKNSENIRPNINASYNAKLGNQLRRRLLVTIGGGYNANLSGTFMYGGANADYPTVTELETKDWNYLTTDYYDMNISATYSQQFSKAKKMNFYAKAAFDYKKASGDVYNHRNYTTVTVGVNF
jgi:hydrogenase maturation factor